MVGPSTSEADQAAVLRRLRVGFAVLVGASMALTALYGEAEASVVGGAFLGGTAAGAVLAWWIFPDTVGLQRGE